MEMTKQAPRAGAGLEVQLLVKQAFKAALRLPPDFELKPEHKFMDVPGWDSVGHMALVAELEKQLEISFNLEEIVALTSVQAIEHLAAHKKGAICK
jgi:acyl carrier protein